MAKGKVPDRLDGPRTRYHTRGCMGCRHQHGYDTCAAFPDGIPDDIYFDRVSHRAPYPGDGGLQWAAQDTEVQAMPADTLKRILDSGV